MYKLPSLASNGASLSSSQILQSACSLHAFQTLLVPGQCRAVTRCAVTRYHQRGVGVTYGFVSLHYSLPQSTFSLRVNTELKLSNAPVHPSLLLTGLCLAVCAAEKFTLSSCTQVSSNKICAKTIWASLTGQVIGFPASWRQREDREATQQVE